MHKLEWTSGLLRYAVWNISVARNKKGDFTTVSPTVGTNGEMTRPGDSNEPLWSDIEQCLSHDNLASDGMTNLRLQKRFPSNQAAPDQRRKEDKHKPKVGDEAFGASCVFMFVRLDVHKAQNRLCGSRPHWPGESSEWQAWQGLCGHSYGVGHVESARLQVTLCSLKLIANAS